MIVIRDAGNGRFEVHAEGRHWEAFEGTLGALLAAQGLAGQIAEETGGPVVIQTPWGEKRVEAVRLRSGLGALLKRRTFPSVAQ